MVLSLEQNTFIVTEMAPCRMESGFILPKEEFFGKFPNDNIVKANLIPHIRRIVDKVVATGSVEKRKSVGRSPVNEEITEDLRQRMEQN
jgi:hypothetical protein